MEQVEYTLRFRGSVHLEEPLDMQRRFTVQIEAECSEVSKKDNHDGTFEVCYKGDLVSVVDLQQGGKKIKATDKSKKSQKLRNRIWLIGQDRGVPDSEAFYEMVMNKIIEGAEEFVNKI